jgi:hypothetical protein
MGSYCLYYTRKASTDIRFTTAQTLSSGAALWA